MDEAKKTQHLVSRFETIFTSGIAVSAFLAGSTLNVAVTAEGKGMEFTRVCAAVSSMLFVFGVLLCALGSIVFAYYRDDIVRVWHDKRYPITSETGRMWLRRGLLGLLVAVWVCIASAVVCFFLVMLKFAPRVGALGLAVASILIFPAQTYVLWKFLNYDKKTMRNDTDPPGTTRADEEQTKQGL